MKYHKEKLGGKNPIYYTDKKSKVPRNKFNHGSKRPAYALLNLGALTTLYHPSI